MAKTQNVLGLFAKKIEKVIEQIIKVLIIKKSEIFKISMVN